MKKVLFATTALVASAGIASAQGVALSGSAEMGVVGGSVYADEFQFWTDVDVKFTFSGETDNGLTFGGSVDLDESTTGLAFAGTTEGGETVFLSGSFGTVTMGDTDGALDWAMTEVGMLGSIDDAHTAHLGYSGNSAMDGFDGKDGQIARYEYSFGDFAFAASVEIDDTEVDDPTFGAGAKYAGTLGGLDLGVGIGYQAASGPGFDSSAIGASVSLGFSGFTLVGNYTTFDSVTIGGVAVDSHYAVGASYTIDAISLTANYGVFERPAGNASGFGVAANYDLGGGAVVQLGYGSSTNDIAGAADPDQFSLGIAMSF